jgi:hypothetical protein
MIFRRLKKTITSVQKRRKQLENGKIKQLEVIEHMYEHIAQHDPKVSEIEKSHTLLHPKGMLHFRIMGAVIAYVSYIAFQTLDIIYLIASAFVISMIMDAPIVFFSKYVSRSWAIALAYFLIFSLMFVVAVVIMPFVITQLVEVIKIGIAKINEFQLLINSQ